MMGAGAIITLALARREGSTIFGGESCGPVFGEDGATGTTGTTARSTSAKKRIAGVVILVDCIKQPVEARGK
jgi:hypothetical protein